jgi:hypothetical protein
MRRDQLLQHIGASSRPVTTSDATRAVGLPATPETYAAVDILLELSAEVTELPEGWTVSADTRERRILGGLRAYVEAHPSKRIFRSSAALGHLPPEDQMTEDQLRDLLASTGEFQLLANAMIKRSRDG